MIDFLARGGPLMIPLLICSVLALAIILERAFSLRSKRIIRGDTLNRVRTLLAENQVGEAMTLCRRQPSVMGRILLAAIVNHDRDREELKNIVEDSWQPAPATKSKQFINSQHLFISVMHQLSGFRFKIERKSIKNGARE